MYPLGRVSTLATLTLLLGLSTIPTAEAFMVQRWQRIVHNYGGEGRFWYWQMRSSCDREPGRNHLDMRTEGVFIRYRCYSILPDYQRR